MTLAASTGRTSVARDADERSATLALWGAIAVGVVIRLLVARGQGFPSDVGTFMAWAERMAAIGPSGFYEPGYFSDYPPGFLYVLWALGALFDGEVLRFAVKAISIPFDIAIALLLAAAVAPLAGRAAAAFAGALWMLQPGPIFGGPYWGQVDAAGTLPLLAALLAAGRRRWILAGALAAVAAMVKPQFGVVAVPLAFAAAFELVRRAEVRPVAGFALGGLVTAALVAIPFRLGPAGFVDLLRAASETYPYTSLYAFNVWSIVADFWKPDQAYFGIGAVLLAAGIVGSIVPLWWRRDTAMLLATAGFAAMAFYFLPTRAHERYIFPALALLVPFAATRSRMLVLYLVLAIAFFVSLYFAFTRYPQNGVAAPQWLEVTLFSRNGQIVIALVMLAATALIVWRLLRGEARLEPTLDLGSLTSAAPPRAERWRLPAGLAPGRLPSRRDVAVALLVALAVLATRGYRLDHPREMYFDEVYHARTAFELLAQREPYEWTHPHLAKEIMAVGIVLFGADRVIGEEPAPRGATAFAVSNEGLRVYGLPDGTIELRERGGSHAKTLARLDGQVRHVAFSGSTVVALTDRSMSELGTSAVDALTGQQLVGGPQRTRPITGPVTSFAVTDTRAVLGTPAGVHFYSLGNDTPPVVTPIPVAALTAKPDGSEIYVADTAGAVHIIDPGTGRPSTLVIREGARPITGGSPASAIAYSRAADRIFTARANEPALDWYAPPRIEDGVPKEGNHIARVSLANGRTGDLRGPIQALAIVPRTGFLYALTDGKAVVVETVGGSPYAAIPIGGLTTGTGGLGPALGVDGTADKLLVAQLGYALGSPGWAPKEGAWLIETGRHAFAWRVPGVLLAAVLAFFLVLLARRLFASDVLPAIVGIAVVLDGSMFAQARIGMNDIYVATFIVVAWYFVVAAHRPRRRAWIDLALAGIALGLAAASKWVAFYAIAAVGLASVIVTARAWAEGRPGAGGPLDLLAARRWAPWRLPGLLEKLAEWLPERMSRGLRPLRLLVQGSNAALLAFAFVVIPITIYVASYLPWFGGATAPYGWSPIDLTKQMYWYHSGLTAPHPAGSPWWSWPLVLKPVYWYLGQPGAGATAVIYDTGNVVLYWGGLVAVAWAAVAAARARSVGLAFLLFAMLAQYVAWIPIARVLFFYHFFTALPFYLLILAAGLVAMWESGRRVLVVGYLAVAAGVLVFFYPFISGQPVPADQAGMFYILPTWQYDCQFYPSFRCNAALPSDIPAAAVLTRVAIAAAAALGAAAVFALTRDGARARLRTLVAGLGRG